MIFLKRQLWLLNWKLFAEIIPQQLTAEWLLLRLFIVSIIEQLFYIVKSQFSVNEYGTVPMGLPNLFHQRA